MLTEPHFDDVLANVKRIVRHKSFKEVQLLRHLLQLTSFLTDEQFSTLLLTIAHIEGQKKPSCKDEFNRIVAGLRKDAA